MSAATVHHPTSLRETNMTRNETRPAPIEPTTKDSLLGATLSLSFSTAVARAVRAFERERAGAGAGALTWVRWGGSVREGAHYEDGVESEFGGDEPIDEKASMPGAWLAGLAVEEKIVRLPGDGVFIKPRQAALDIEVEVEAEPEFEQPTSSYSPSPVPELDPHDPWECVEVPEPEQKPTWARRVRQQPRLLLPRRQSVVVARNLD